MQVNGDVGPRPFTKYHHWPAWAAATATDAGYIRYTRSTIDLILFKI